MAGKKDESRMERDDYKWEKPENPRYVEKDLPHDKEIITEKATISRDSKGQFFVRFPKEISEALKLSTEYSMEFTVVLPKPQREGLKVNRFVCEVLRRPKKRKVKKDAR